LSPNDHPNPSQGRQKGFELFRTKQRKQQQFWAFGGGMGGPELMLKATPVQVQ